jgi:hypothetical protein
MQPAVPPSAPIRAKVIRVGNSMGVRLPATMGLALGMDVEVIVRPVNAWPEGYFDMEAVGEGFEVPAREGAAAADKRFDHLFGARRI